MSSLTLVPNFYLLFIVLIVGGLSIYFYHAIGPADIGQVSEKSLGSILAIWNIAGQVGFLVGPLVITAILTSGAYRKLPYLFVVGVLLSVVSVYPMGKDAGGENKWPGLKKTNSVNWTARHAGTWCASSRLL